MDYGPRPQIASEGVEVVIMALTKTDKAPVTPHSLQGRCAHVMYLAANEGQTGFPAFLSLGAAEREKYERMAAAALSLAYREPVVLS